MTETTKKILETPLYNYGSDGMTEIEKKAREYQESLSDDYLDNTYEDKIIEKVYKDGYEQGQKDKKFDIFSFQADLEKENEELKEKINSLQGYLDHDIEYDIEQENLKLKAQIEKMKCCGNCRKLNYDLDHYPCCEKISYIENVCAKCDEWELAE